MKIFKSPEGLIEHYRNFQTILFAKLLICKSFSYQVPEPVAFFPLNGTFAAKEINDRTAQGDPSRIILAPGPDGKANGSYKFFGFSNSYIKFPNSAGGALDICHSITMLCWLFYDSGQGPIFGYKGVNANRGVTLGIIERKISVLFKTEDDSFTPTLSHSIELTGTGWRFVGASYDRDSGEAKLWVDGHEVEAKNIGAGHDLATQGSVLMGEGLESKIAQMHVYNLALTQEQIKTIQKRTQVPG